MSTAIKFVNVFKNSKFKNETVRLKLKLDDCRKEENEIATKTQAFFQDYFEQYPHSKSDLKERKKQEKKEKRRAQLTKTLY